ncbi:MAG: transcriptional regulator [Candidatus Marinimicrobia bacterium]|nr:transcriptional regulator [Candidatus Neomarinimicrobiota bacterium]
MKKFQPLNQIIHAQVRLSILTLLISVKEADFVYLKESVGTTDGNLSVHLTKLEDTGYIKITKKFVSKKPKTICSISAKGRNAYQEYILALEQYLIHPEKK